MTLRAVEMLNLGSINRRRATGVGPVLALVAVFLGLTFLDPHFASAPSLEAILESAAVAFVLATGETFIVLMGSIDLSVEGVMGAACMTVTLLVHNNVNTNDYGVLGIAVAIFVGSLIGLCNGLLNVYVRLPSLIATIGTWFAGLGYAYIIFPAHQPGLLYRPLTDLVVHKIFGLSVIVYISLAILAAAHLVFRYSVLGRAIYAIGGDEEIATLNAIPIGRVRIAAFTIAGTLFAVAGVLVAAQLENGYPNAGRDLLFPTIGAAVIGGTLLSGGRGGPLHSAVGVLTLGVLTNGMIQLGVGSYTRNIVIGAAIILAVAIGNWHLRHRLRVVK